MKKITGKNGRKSLTFEKEKLDRPDFPPNKKERRIKKTDAKVRILIKKTQG
jgi:hypothetical protein